MKKDMKKTSISDIAREMDVAQGLCYRYFSSKEELFDTALDQYAQRQVDRISSILDPHKPLTELIPADAHLFRDRRRGTAMPRSYVTNLAIQSFTTSCP